MSPSLFNDIPICNRSQLLCNHLRWWSNYVKAVTVCKETPNPFDTRKPRPVRVITKDHTTGVTNPLLPFRTFSVPQNCVTLKSGQLGLPFSFKLCKTPRSSTPLCVFNVNVKSHAHQPTLSNSIPTPHVCPDSRLTEIF